jgi:hypothetical protein
VDIIGRREGGLERPSAARAQSLRELPQAIAREVSEISEGVDLGYKRISGLGEEIYRRMTAPRLMECVKDAARMTDQVVAKLDDAVAELYGTKDGTPISLPPIWARSGNAKSWPTPPTRRTRTLWARGARNGAPWSAAHRSPPNLSAAFRCHMDDYFVFDGGFARLPEGSRIDFVGMPGGTLAYGCLSETLLLAFNRRHASFARGPLTVAQVLETIRLAEQYGFTLGELKLGDKVRLLGAYSCVLRCCSLLFSAWCEIPSISAAML